MEIVQESQCTSTADIQSEGKVWIDYLRLCKMFDLQMKDPRGVGVCRNR